MAKAKNYWLMKTEPDVYSIDDLKRERTGIWEGVRNYQARNHMRNMQVGDLALFYHSNAKPPGVVGLARISKTAYTDHTQFDPKSKYYDAKSKPEEPRWSMVDVSFAERFDGMIALDELKSDKQLEGMLVAKKGMRLSVQPVDGKHFKRVLKLAGAKSKA